MLNVLMRAAADAALKGAAAGAAAGWASRKAQPASSTPMWSAEVNGATLAVMAEQAHGRQSYQLFVISGGAWSSAGRYWFCQAFSQLAKLARGPNRRPPNN